MRSTVRNLAMGGASALFALAAASGLVAGPAAAAPGNPLDNVSYYTVTNTGGGGFCRSAAPSMLSLASGGADSQSRNRAGNGPVGLSIDGATGYTDDGFYLPVGTLGNLSGYSIDGRGAFGDNLWFDANSSDDASPNGAWFDWSGGSPDCLTGLGGDGYGLGPSSSSTGGDQSEVTVDDSSSFFMVTGPCGVDGFNVTLAELKAGACPGINPATPVALWIGITAPTGGSQSATINSVQVSRSGQ